MTTRDQASAPSADRPRGHTRRAVLAATVPTVAALGLLGWGLAPRPGGLGDAHGDADLAAALRPHLADQQRVGIALLRSGETRIAGFGAGDEFEIGSVSKTFTGALLMSAVAAEELSLDTTVADVLGERADGSALADTPVSALAAHTSGLPRLAGGGVGSSLISSAIRRDPYRGGPEQVLDDGLSADLSGVGEVAYSNLGVAVLGQLLAHHLGASWADLVAERLTDRLDMPATWAPVTADALDPSHPRGHDALGRPTGAWTMDGSAPAGGIRSTAEDMALWLGGMMDGSNPGAAGLEPLADDAEGGGQVAVSWFLDPTADGDRIIWHNGATGGFSSFCGWRPETGTGIVLLADSAHAVDELGMAVLSEEVPIP